MRTVFILKGLPASGKSTYAKKLIQKEPNRFVRVNRDSLREMFNYSNYSKDSEEFIRSIQDQLIIKSLREGYDVICDNTFLVPQTLRKLHRLLASVGDVKVIEVPFNESIAECVRRNELREGKAKIPQEVIHKMAKAAGLDRGRALESRETYYPPREQSIGKYVANEALPKAIICDLDGTLALMNGRNPFDASTCDQDLPNTPVIECVKAMLAHGYKLVFMSGREDKYREPTERFIAQHLPGVQYELHMRVSGDSRKDSIVKGELFDAHVAEKYNVVFVLDDRNQVVDFWRSIGLTVFQVAERNF